MNRGPRGIALMLIMLGGTAGEVPAQVADPVRLLVLESGQLVGMIRQELGGTLVGRNLEIRANALLGAAESLERELRLRHADVGRRLRALEDVERTLGQVQQVLFQPPGQAPGSESIARRLGAMLGSIRQGLMAGGGNAVVPPVQPPIVSPGGAGYDPRRILPAVDATAQAVRLLADRLDAQMGAIYPYNGVVLNLRSLDGGLQRFRALAQQGAPLGKLQATLPPLRNLARTTGDQLLAARPPQGIAAAWNAIPAGLATLNRLIGLDLDYVVDPTAPVLINPPAYDELPWTQWPGGGGGWQPGGGNIFAIIDSAVGELDGFLLAMQPNVLVIPEAPRIQAESRTLRNSLLRLREQLAIGGASSGLGPALRRVEADYRQLATRIQRVSGGRSGPNIQRIERVGQFIGSLRTQLGV